MSGIASRAGSNIGDLSRIGSNSSSTKGSSFFFKSVGQQISDMKAD